MIPKLAIEKAIEGGWNPLRLNITDTKNDAVETYRHAWQMVALDPAFWQCLGKALRVTCGEHVAKGYCANCDDKGYHQTVGIYSGKEFCGIVLTGGDTDAYWKEILGVAHETKV